MPTPAARARLQQLRAAFDVLALGDPGLTLLPQPPPREEEAAQFTLRLVGAGSPRVTLRIRTREAHLRAHSGADHASAGDGEIHDHLEVSLVVGFAWDDSVCDSAGELAGLLLKHMRRRLKHVDELTPQG